MGAYLGWSAKDRNAFMGAFVSKRKNHLVHLKTLEGVIIFNNYRGDEPIQVIIHIYIEMSQ
jgi:hypothetical protein